MRNRLPVLFAALSLVAVGAGIAAAQSPYSSPTISAGDAGLFRLTVNLTAGATGAPGGFGVQWMKKSDNDLYGWDDTRLSYCECTGPFTLNMYKGDGSANNPALTSGSSAYLQIGDLADESGVTGYAPAGLYYSDPLGDPNARKHYPATAYVIRAYALGDANGDVSDFSNQIIMTTMSSECTQGFWKNHGPTGCSSGNNADVWPASCFPMQLGNVVYTKTQICQILQQNPGGNGLISLAHQLITALMNDCNNSSPPPSVVAAIANAQSMIGNLVIPPVGGGFLAPGSTSSTTQTLDDYNNGLLGGVADCPTPAHSSTWGRVKVLYR